jgi:hypothetical protein
MLSGGSEERLGAIGTVSIFPSEHEAPDGATNWVFCAHMAHMTDNKPWISPSIRGCQAYLQIPNEVELYLHYGSLDHFIPIISIIFPLYPHLHMDHFQGAGAQITADPWLCRRWPKLWSPSFVSCRCKRSPGVSPRGWLEGIHVFPMGNQLEPIYINLYSFPTI